MAARLTDKQKKNIIKDYIECGSYNAVAKKYNISDTTVARVVRRDPKTAKKADDKKEQNTLDILAHMDGKKGTVNQIIDAYLERLLEPEVIKKANSVQVATVLGIVIDKFTSPNVSIPKNEAEIDPLSKSLKEEAERMNNGDLS